MTLHLGKGRSLASALVTLVVLCLSVLVLPAVTAPADAATPLTVSQAIGQQTGATQTVRGYVVGQPTATSTVVRSGFPSDYALAIADSAAQTSTSSMLYVQIPAASRSQWGLKSNPSLMGKQIDVTGTLAAYFSHPGMTNTSAFALSSGGPSDPPPTGGTGPWGPAHLAPRHHRQQHHAVLRRRLDGAEGHRPGPQQHLQRHRALHRSLHRQDQQRRRHGPVEP